MRCTPSLTLHLWGAPLKKKKTPRNPTLVPCCALFPPGDLPTSAPRVGGAEGGDTEEDPHKRRNQLLSVLVGLAAMLGYAFLSGIVSIQRGAVGPAGRQPIALEEEEEEEEE